MKYVVTISTATPPEFRAHCREIIVESRSSEEAFAKADPHDNDPWSVVGSIKTLARHRHDQKQIQAGESTRPARKIPRSKHDTIIGDRILFRFGRSQSRPRPISHEMSLNGWFALIARCRGDSNIARSIVARVANGDLPNQLPA